MLRIKKNDQVIVITGKDKGKTGKVLFVFPRESRAVVENLNKIKKSQRKSQQNPKGGFAEIEMPIHLSNLKLIDKKTHKPTRFGSNILKDGTKVRISKKTEEVI